VDVYAHHGSETSSEKSTASGGRRERAETPRSRMALSKEDEPGRDKGLARRASWC
jgi:hypothetical protein